MDPTPSVPTPSLFSLKGKSVLLTGGTRGIGASCAIALAEAGASICLVQRNLPKGTPPNHETLNAIRALGARAEVVYCDLDNMEAVKGLFQAALNVMGGQIHVLVNCAGIQRRSPSLDFPENDWDDVINVNLKSVWLLSQAAGRHMVPLRRGKIINFCSLLTFQGGLTVPAYASAKGALGQLTKALSNEWSQHNVQVNAICPGYIATDMWVLIHVPRQMFNPMHAACHVFFYFDLHFQISIDVLLGTRGSWQTLNVCAKFPREFQPDGGATQEISLGLLSSLPVMPASTFAGSCSLSTVDGWAGDWRIFQASSKHCLSMRAY
ncbi:hypothetical protein H2248_012384 [Termitomyces sp. 'cryptogamus']|nr:hypothetical protein H2248_012384 [Termitomyces sp. 'cryptogamus']